MSTVTTQPPPQAPDPGDEGDGPGPNGWIDLFWRVTGDHRRAGWTLAFVVVFLVAFATVTAILAPHLGALGVLGGVGAGGAGSAVLEFARRRRCSRDTEQE